MGTKHSRHPDALDLLAKQHAAVDALIKRLERKSVPMEQARATFIALADAVAAHATIEEKIFYPAVLAKKTAGMLLEATEEHLQIKRMLADLMGIDVRDERFRAKLAVLKEELTHHAHEEEEDKLFPELRATMSTGDLQALGREMQAMFDDLMTHAPRENVPAEARKAAPL